VDAFAQSVIDFIAENREWAFWIALVFAAGETMALVSIIIPSTIILIGVGALVATGAVSFWPIWAGAAVGALIGSTFSWWLGRRYGETILRLWPLSRHPELVFQGRAAFARWGSAAIIIGHFFGPLRPVVFLMCGMAPMTLARFTPWNALGGIAWAGAMPLTGLVGGSLIGWVWGLFGFG
jgi:membrane protein DedA with SNARE-associated domain